MQGARITQVVDVKHHARQFGKSKYGLGRTFRNEDLLRWCSLENIARNRCTFLGQWVLSACFSALLLTFMSLRLPKSWGEDIWGKTNVVTMILVLGEYSSSFTGISLATICALLIESGSNQNLPGKKGGQRIKEPALKQKLTGNQIRSCH